MNVCNKCPKYEKGCWKDCNDFWVEYIMRKIGAEDYKQLRKADDTLIKGEERRRKKAYRKKSRSR